VREWRGGAGKMRRHRKGGRKEEMPTGREGGGGMGEGRAHADMTS